MFAEIVSLFLQKQALYSSLNFLSSLFMFVLHLVSVSCMILAVHMLARRITTFAALARPATQAAAAGTHARGMSSLGSRPAEKSRWGQTDATFNSVLDRFAKVSPNRKRVPHLAFCLRCSAAAGCVAAGLAKHDVNRCLFSPPLTSASHAGSRMRRAPHAGKGVGRKGHAGGDRRWLQHC